MNSLMVIFGQFTQKLLRRHQRFYHLPPRLHHKFDGFCSCFNFSWIYVVLIGDLLKTHILSFLCPKLIWIYFNTKISRSIKFSLYFLCTFWRHLVIDICPVCTHFVFKYNIPYFFLYISWHFVMHVIAWLNLLVLILVASKQSFEDLGIMELFWLTQNVFKGLFMALHPILVLEKNPLSGEFSLSLLSFSLLDDETIGYEYEGKLLGI